MVRTKVFVGNLSFKTREAELAQEFSSVAKVISANIITRGPRSLGYGFVELESEDDAQKAVAAMDKKEIDGRPINVEVANIRQEGEAAEGEQGQQQGGATRGGRGGARGAARGGARGGAARGTGAPRGAFRGAARGGARGGARRAYVPANGEQAEGGEEQQQQQAPKERRPRGQKKEGGESNKPDTRVESQTSLFVANLPFSLTDETFGKVFSDEGLKFKTAHVVTKRNGRSKGFGFVEFDNHDDQQKALTAINNKKVEERELVLRVALTDEAKDAQKEEQNAAPTATATATTTTTTEEKKN